jgi:isocitrate/isopropylmalate dehydrogenase
MRQVKHEFLDEDELAALLMRSIEAVLRQGHVRTHDLGGGSSTIEMTDVVSEVLESEVVKA